MTKRELVESHDWHDAEYVNQWITSDHRREKERLPWLQTLVSFIPFTRDEAIRVLDIGSGYGILSRFVLEAFPHARVYCHDFSEAMFAQSREVLKDYAAQVSWVKSDLLSPDWTKELDGPFDAIVSSIAIHNVGSSERIRSIYRELFPFVRKGGCFLNLDYIGPAGDVSTGFYNRARLQEKQRRLKEEKGVEKSLEELAGELQETRETGRSGSMEAQLRWLHEAGFDEVECFCKDMRRIIIGGYRSPG